MSRRSDLDFAMDLQKRERYARLRAEDAEKRAILNPQPMDASKQQPSMLALLAAAAGKEVIRGGSKPSAAAKKPAAKKPAAKKPAAKKKPVTKKKSAAKKPAAKKK